MSNIGNYKKAIDGVPPIISMHFDIDGLIIKKINDEFFFHHKLLQLQLKYEKDPMKIFFLTIQYGISFVNMMVNFSKSKKHYKKLSNAEANKKAGIVVSGESLPEAIEKKDGSKIEINT